MQVVHLFPREPKFFLGAQLFFNALEVSQTWLIRCPQTSLSQFPALTGKHHVAQFISSESIPNSTKLVVVHYLDHEMAQLILELPRSIPKFVQTWGGDLEPLYPSHKLYDPFTFKWIYDKTTARNLPIQIGKILYDLNRRWKHRNWIYALRQSMKHATMVSAGMGQIEANCLKLGIEIEAECINYYGTNKDYNTSAGKTNSILLGNSSNPSNNHLDALHRLRKSSLDIEKIVIPLNYGDSDYRKWLLPKALQIFGNRIIPIIDFMPEKDYFNSVSDCGIVFMNHYRQQALGSIQWAFNSQKQVVLHKDSIGLAFFASNPPVVHSAEDINHCTTKPVIYNETTIKIIKNKLQNHNRTTLHKNSKLYQLMTSV